MHQSISDLAFRKSYLKFFIILIGIFASIINTVSFATPSSPDESIVFLGRSSDGEKSIWLSITNSGSFEVQARNQTIDQWDEAQRGLHVTVSPIVSNGSGDPHSLYRVVNGELVFIDKDNQQGGIIFPPFPGSPPDSGLPPGIPTHPIAPGSPGIPTHPIEPISPGTPTHPIEPGSPNIPEHPIILPSDEITQKPSTSESENLDESGFGSSVPITRGREFVKKPLWNLWADARNYNFTDNRNNLDLSGNTANFTVGADHLVNNKLVGGVMLTKTGGRSSSFDDTWKSNSYGWNLAGYFGYLASKHWAIDGTLGYGQFKNENDISVLTGKYTMQTYSANITGTGQYSLGAMQLRPKPAIYYTNFHNSSYNLNAIINGTGIIIPIETSNFNLGVSELALEASLPFVTSKGKVIVPYIELGVDYLFARPNGGRMLSGDLTMVSTSPWNGIARIGARALITKSLFVEAAASYLSIGQPGLRIWEERLYLSYAL